MRVQILDIVQQGAEPPLVNFKTFYGSGRAKWSEKHPQLFGEYEVEIEIEEVLTWGETIIEIEDGEVVIYDAGETLVIEGRLEVVDPDDVVAIRLGPSIFLAETAGTPAQLGAMVRVKANHVMLFPYDHFESGDPVQTIYHDHYRPTSHVQPTTVRSSPLQPTDAADNKGGPHLTIRQPANVFSLTTYKSFLERWLQAEERRYQARSDYALSDSLRWESSLLVEEYVQRLPIYPLSRCPYCGALTLEPVDTFSLSGFFPAINMNYMYEMNGYGKPVVYLRKRCRHAITITFSVNLHGRLPDDLPAWMLSGKWGPLHSAPRVMVWPLIAVQTSAVIHSLPIGRLDDPEPMHRYTVYFVTYFAEDSSNLRTPEMWVPNDFGGAATGGVLHDPDLLKWVRAKRLLWMAQDSSTQLVDGPVDDFPYANIQPQGWYHIIENGQVDGPKPYWKTWDGPAPLPDESLQQTIE